METIKDEAALDALYGDVVPASVDKVVDRMTPCYRRWISTARFVVLGTVGPEGTDGSPRGDDGPVVTIADDKTLMLPDWRGNNRIDSLRNILRDGRVSLMFMVPGCDNVVRVNGDAVLTADEQIRARFEKGGKVPRVVIVIRIGEMYFQCAKALMRSELWSGSRPDVPTAGQFIREFKEGFDAENYDADYAERARPRFW